MSLNIKLVFDSEIHRLSNIPDSYASLLSYCSKLFPSVSTFSIKYLDEESDEITIACDSDLETAYASAISQDQRSLRLLLSNQKPSAYSLPSEPSQSFCSSRAQNDTVPEPVPDSQEPPHVWARYTCDGCNTKPIVGARFNCTVCQDFDFCDNCEKAKNHQHPFLKFVKPSGDQYVNLEINPENVFKSLMRIKEMIYSQAPKMEIIRTEDINGQSAGEILLRWKVRNSGGIAWPEGCRVELVKGNLSAIFQGIPCLQPGEEGDIMAKAWSDGGKVLGKWKVLTPEGFKIGKIAAKGAVKNDLDEKIGSIVEMGFAYQDAKQALLKNGGDINKAVLSLS